MTAALAPAIPVSPSVKPVSVTPRFQNAQEWVRRLGNVPLHRILLDPPPGTATLADVIRLSNQENRGVELVNGTLVEKPVGMTESLIASNLIRLLGNYAEAGKRGLVSGEQGMVRMLMGNVRMPDVAYFRRNDLPDGQMPRDAAPRVAPAIAVEVLSESNTDEEMRIKVREYFESGVQIVWMLDPPTKTLRVYDGPDRFRQLTAADVLEGSDLLPGFTVQIGNLFET